MKWFLVLALILLVPRATQAFKVGVSRLELTKTSVTTGMPRVLDPVVWYPAAIRRGSPDGSPTENAPVRRGRYPLIVFSHGSCGRPTEATYYTTALASRGFIVVAPHHPGNTADDGLVTCVTMFVDSALNRFPDVQTTIDATLAAAADSSSRFAGHIRTDLIGMTGLSFGGFTTLFAAQQEPRIVAALSMVPGGTSALAQGPENDITIPTMVIGAERDQVVGYAESPLAFARLAGPRFLVKLLAANHLSVVDDCFNEELNVSLCVPEDITQDAAHALVVHYAVPFFRRYLLNVRGAGRTLVRQIDGVELTAEPKR
jgi:predicted dienelactone hydrolase